MINVAEKEKCFGCTACMNICPQQCIRMDKDDEGFLYPEVHEEKCVSCNLCDNVCIEANNLLKEKNYNQRFYASYAKNEKIIENSQSGGLFQVIAQNILANENGKVCGALFNENMKVEHYCTDDIEICKKFSGSKYIQSDLRNIFCEVKEDLEKGNKVLFSGTPCQVAGLKNYLKKDYESLYTIDLICTGVESPGLFCEYIQYKQKKYLSKIYNWTSRSKKRNGWENGELELELENEQRIYLNKKSDLFCGIISKKLAIRPSCLECKFANIERVGDITLGDFWGIGKLDPSFGDRKKGISLLILNSAKGESLFDNISNNIVSKEVSCESALKGQPRLRNKKHEKYKRHDQFWKDYRNKGFLYASRKHALYYRIIDKLIR